MNKRDFVAACCGALGAPVAMATPHLPAVSTVGGVAGLPVLTGLHGSQGWRPYLDQAFETDGGAALVLRTVTSLGVDKHGEQYTLSFSAAPGASPVSATCSLRHASGGRAQLLLTPAGTGADGQALYRADFWQ